MNKYRMEEIKRIFYKTYDKLNVKKSNVFDEYAFDDNIEILRFLENESDFRLEDFLKEKQDINLEWLKEY